ncbi:MAG: MarR family winged helix-turn-helix transcriptional regulator, partial [Lachnospiraceae bacterium]|nr:MarR family winged helix-turn-helix transcriptional regulator [Lachnospiraceae bacterium]
ADDNRCNHVEITPKGERVVMESRQTFDELDEELLGGLSREELGQLNEYLRRIKSTAYAKAGCCPAVAEPARGCGTENQPAVCAAMETISGGRE